MPGRTSGLVYARVYTGGTNLFPDFDNLPSGTKTQTKLLPAGPYRFYAGAVAQSRDNTGVEASRSNTASITLRFGPVSGVETRALRPARAEIALTPNPSRGKATVSLAIPEASEVEVTLYDASGRRIDTLQRSYMEAGRASFVWRTERPLSGVYFAQVRGRTFSATTRVTFLK